VVVLSVVNGFEREMRERVLGVLPHITAEVRAGMPENLVRQFVAAGPHNGMQAITPYASGTVLLAANDRIRGALVTGVDPATYGEVTDIPQFTARGDLDSLYSARYGIILGRKLAQQLQVASGDRVLVVLPLGAISPVGAIPRQRRFTVVDVFDSSSMLDAQQALISLPVAQKLFRLGERVQGVQGRLLDLFVT